MNDLTLLCMLLIIIIQFIIITLYAYGFLGRKRRLPELQVKDLWLIRERLKLMSPRQFEISCANIFNHFDGCKADVTNATADGGKDIVLKDNGKLIFIECKHYTPTEENKEPVSRPIAQKLKGCMDYGLDGKTPADGGIIMTTSTFTDECEEYCEAMGIKMMDLNDIMKMVEKIGTEDVYVDVGITYDGQYIYEDL